MNSIESFASTTSAPIPSSAEGTVQLNSPPADAEALGMLRSLIAESGQPPLNHPSSQGQGLVSSPVPMAQGHTLPAFVESELKEAEIQSDAESEATLSASTMAALCAFFGTPNASSLNTLPTRASSSENNRLSPEFASLLLSNDELDSIRPQILTLLGATGESTSHISLHPTDAVSGITEPTISTGSATNAPRTIPDEIIAQLKDFATQPPKDRELPSGLPSAIEWLRGLARVPGGAISEAAPRALVNKVESPDATAASIPAEAPASPPVNLGQAILQTLDHQSSSSVPTASETQAHVQRIEQVSALMTEMADRVLVTDPLHGQTQEVRIKLADHIMPDTEVRVWQGEGGQLRVEFETSSGYWARVLNEASPQLAQHLNEKLVLPEAAMVSVNQQGSQPEDGRSRNRYTPWDLAASTEDS